MSDGEKKYAPGWSPLERFYSLIVPLRAAARSCGYALGVHGSLARDIDLIAAPWTKEATDSSALGLALVKATGDLLGFEPPYGNNEGYAKTMPHGRVSWAIHLGAGPYIDLSIMPRLRTPGTKEEDGT